MTLNVNSLLCRQCCACCEKTADARIHAASCALHQLASRVIHRLQLYNTVFQVILAGYVGVKFDCTDECPYIDMFPGGLKTRCWKRRTVKNAWSENAGLENAAPNCKTGKCGKRHVWRTSYHHHHHFIVIRHERTHTKQEKYSETSVN